MADVKITDLAALTAPASADLLEIVDDVAGTATSKKIVISDLFGGSTALPCDIITTEDLISGTLTSGATVITPTGNAVGILIDNDGTNHGLQITQDGVLAASDYGLYVYSDAAQVNSPLAYIHQDNASSDQNALSIVNDGTGYGLHIDQNGSEIAALFDTDAASDYIAYFRNAGDNANRYGIRVQAGADDASGDTYYFRAEDGDGDQIGYIWNTSGTFQLVDGSDERLKENIVDTKINGLDLINALRVVDHGWIKNDHYAIGSFIGQEVAAVLPEAARAGEDGMYGVSRERMVPYIVKGLQEADVKIENNTTKLDDHQSRLEDLEKENKDLKEQIKQLTAG